jgi:predicted amidohydrolase
MANPNGQAASVVIGLGTFALYVPLLALEHLRVIDGTGAAARADQTVLIVGDRIVQIGPSASTVVPNDAARVDLTGRAALPGLVGMHDHLFYVVNQPDDGYLVHDMPFSYPRLYLTAGVTTIRTTGSYEPNRLGN